MRCYKINIIIKLVAHQKDHRRYQHIKQCQRYLIFPAKVHQLIVTEKRNCPTYPHKEEDKHHYFSHQGNNTDSCSEVSGMICRIKER